MDCVVLLTVNNALCEQPGQDQTTTMSQSYTTYYLEMLAATALNAKTNSNGLIIQEVQTAQFQFNRFLYQLVGEQWQWTDKLSWPDDQWKAYVEDENLRTWVAYSSGAIAGYFELIRDNHDTEIKYFGLAPQFFGNGFGGFLLSQAIANAWQWSGTQRVWVHTCTLDHPYALKNYLARGFTIYDEKEDYL